MTCRTMVIEAMTNSEVNVNTLTIGSPMGLLLAITYAETITTVTVTRTPDERTLTIKCKDGG